MRTTAAKSLTDRQRRFVKAFYDMSPTGAQLCAAKAARIAGYAWPRQQGARLMTFPHVAAEVERRFGELVRARGRRLKTPKPRRKSTAGRPLCTTSRDCPAS
jgi:hypothetical protein